MSGLPSMFLNIYYIPILTICQALFATLNSDMTHITKKEFKSLLTRLRASAKKRGIPFELTTEDIDEIGIPITCPVLGIPLKFNKGKPLDNSISFDRIDSSKGYTKDNVVIVSHRVNKLKANSTYDEMKKIFEFYSSL